MRRLCLVLGVLLLPLTASAQHSWTLPPIGLPPPPPNPALTSDWGHRGPWVQKQAPLWNQAVPWERRDVDTRRDINPRRGHRGNTQVIYYVPYAAGYYPEPQVIVVQPPPVQIIEVPVPAPAPRNQEPAAIDEPRPAPYVPTGDRTVYVIPGCYVGNVSPVNLKLAANCDITKLTTYVP